MQLLLLRHREKVAQSAARSSGLSRAVIRADVSVLGSSVGILSAPQHSFAATHSGAVHGSWVCSADTCMSQLSMDIVPAAFCLEIPVQTIVASCISGLCTLCQGILCVSQTDLFHTVKDSVNMIQCKHLDALLKRKHTRQDYQRVYPSSSHQQYSRVNCLTGKVHDKLHAPKDYTEF